ncbi:MAG: flippase [Candidatus Aureabacteria bacterium]|nr:flippase [Candidatus Auribacterota bacterium]
MKKFFIRLRRLRKGSSLTSIFFRGATASFSIKVLSVGTSFFMQVFLARLLGVEEYGIYVFAMSWMNYFILTGRLGMDMASVRFVASYNAEKKWSLLNGFIKRSTTISLLSSLIVAAAILAVLSFKEVTGSPHLRLTLKISVWLIPVTALILINEERLRALKRIVQSQLPEHIIRPVMLTLGLFIVYFLIGKKIESYTAMTINCIASFLTLFMTLYFFRKALPSEASGAKPEYNMKVWVPVSFSMLLITSLNIFKAKTDVIMVGLITSATDVGIYNATKQLTTIMLFGLVAANTIIGPMVSELYAEKRMKELQKIVTLAARGIVLFTLPIFLLFLFKGEMVLGFFGDKFRQGHLALAIIAVGQLVNAFAGPVGFILTMTGHHFSVTKILGYGVLLNILLNLIFIPRWGINGAAVSHMVSTIFWNVVLAYLSIKRLGIKGTAL